MINAKPVIPEKMPSTLARSSRPNVPLRIAIASGITSAAPAPCTARAAINHPTVGANAQAAEASVNSAMPTANILSSLFPAEWPYAVKELGDVDRGQPSAPVGGQTVRRMTRESRSSLAITRTAR
jgi:hypothetical protein